MRIVCPDCGMSTWREDFGCTLPGCENYAVLTAFQDLPGTNWEEDFLADSNETETP